MTGSSVSRASYHGGYSYISDFERFEKSLNGGTSSKLHGIRRDALSRFTQLGFPTTHHEEWKYTDVAPLASVPFKPIREEYQSRITETDIQELLLGNSSWPRITFVNGRYAEHLSIIHSLPRGVKVCNLSQALKDGDDVAHRHLAQYAEFGDSAFAALNTAFLKDGAFIHVPQNAVLNTPVHVLYVSTESAEEFVAHPRNLIVAGQNSQATVIESYMALSNARYFTNTVTEAVLGENAVMEHVKLQRESESAFHVGLTQVHQGRNSNFVSNSISIGGAFVRNNIFSVLDGEGAGCILNGLYIGTGKQLVDNHTTIDHAKPNCNSQELYKGILFGESKGVFNGKIIVRKDAQKTDARQTNKNLVLSDNAVIDTKPQLEIFANDVKCTHGATVGQMDPESLFYLRSRGIGWEEARDILMFAFAGEVVERTKVGLLQEKLHQAVQKHLKQGR